MHRLIRLLKTSTFRLAVVYLALFVLSVVTVLGYIYLNTLVLLARQTDETIDAEIVGLAEQYRAGGLQQLVRIVRERSESDSRGVYLLISPLGRPLAGNLPGMPGGDEPRPGWLEFPYDVKTADGVERHAALARHFRLAGDYRLLVGRDIAALRHFELLVRSALAWALALTILLGLGGGLLMSRGFLARIEAITASSRTIMGGNLAERLPLAGSGDELDRLTQSLNDMLDEIERLMGVTRQVTDNIAHDLRTPLARLRARTEDVLRGERERADYRAALERNLEEADRLIATFNALLSIARIEAGAGRGGLVAIDVGATLADAAELYEPVAEQRGIGFSVDIEKGLKALGDRQLLGQAAANLIDNAIKYVAVDVEDRGTRPSVWISARRAGDRVEISVADNGPGIGESDRDRVFDRFVRLEKSRTAPGSGLGLSLVAAVARLHGATVRLECNGPGLRAVMSLPAAV